MHDITTMSFDELHNELDKLVAMDNAAMFQEDTEYTKPRIDTIETEIQKRKDEDARYGKIAMPNGQGEAWINQWYNLDTEAPKEIGIQKASILANLFYIDTYNDRYNVEFRKHGMPINTNQAAPDYHKEVTSTATSFKIIPKG